MTQLPPFRLGLLLKPSYLRPRLRGLGKPGEAARRAWDLARYLGFLGLNGAYGLRGIFYRGAARGGSLFYVLAGLPRRGGAVAAGNWYKARGAALRAAAAARGGWFALRGRACGFSAAAAEELACATGVLAAGLAAPVWFFREFSADRELARLRKTFKPSRQQAIAPNPPSPALANPPAAVQLSWNIHAACNYDCSYCWFHGKWEEFSAGNLYLPAEKWAAHWDRFNDRCGSAEIHIAGGEPLLYPGFTEIVSDLSRRNIVFVITNLALLPSLDLKKLDPAKVAFSASFHPEGGESADAFAEKVAGLRRAGFHAGASIVAYPPFLAGLPDWADAFMARGIYPVVQPFRGEWNKRAYPAAYSRQGAKLVEWLSNGGFLAQYGPSARRAAAGSRAYARNEADAFAREYQLAPRPTRGLPCAAGQSYGRLQFNGDMLRCSQGGYVGKFFDEDFKMAAAAGACPFRRCECANEVLYVQGGPCGPGAL